MTEPSGYYFRVRENGGLMFRLGEETRQRRLDLEPLAAINIRNGEVRAQGGRELSPEDRAAAESWLEERRETLAARRIDDIRRTVDHLNLTAHWVQSQATDEDLDAVTEPLLMAMHDLRSLLVRKTAERLGRGEG